MSYTQENISNRVTSLFDHSQSELDELFSVLPSPQAGELSGVYKGALMAILGLGWLPRRIRVLLYRLLQTFINPWVGKRFDQELGANIWFSSGGRCRWGRYEIKQQALPLDSGKVVFLSYDVKSNPSFLKPIRGEVRKLQNNVYLARMNYLTKRHTLRVLYFTLQK